MALKVEVYQKEKVRPSSPTPQTLRNYKLSLLDILLANFYTPIVFFYDSHAGDHDYDELKDSLMKTLSILYPLAGRMKDGSTTIECNDEGADFVRANVTNCDLGEFLRHPKLEDISQLLPLDPNPNVIHPAQPMLAVQLNRFRCGGTAVAFCVWHGLADAGAMVGLFNTLAAINRGEEPSDPGGLVVDASAIFRPGNFVRPMPRSLKNPGNYSSKRFVFGKQDIERLRNDYYHPSEHPHRPSRVKALSAFIWAAVIRAILPANPNLKTHLLTNVVNLRKKLNPPLPSQCLGNICQAVAARWESEADGGGRVTAGFLVGRVAEAIDKVTDDYLREMHVEGGYLKALLNVSKALHNVDEIKIFSISSWCNFPFSQVDFGWGKPIWIGLVHTQEDLAVFVDAEDGGIEVWIALAQEIMYNLDKDMEFNTYVSFSQIFFEPSCPLRSAVYLEDRERFSPRMLHHHSLVRLVQCAQKTIEVYQKEKVRPSSPTPQTLRNYKLSLLDILVATFYTTIVFFYDSLSGGHDYDELKDSLMKTLSVLYPLAGRMKDGSTTIECNDEGADFVRANVTNCDLDEFLRHPKLEDIRQLLPLDPNPNAIDPSQPMLAVQLNRFRCGGTAVAFCVWHGLADAGAMVGLFNTLAAINRGEGPINPGGLVVDASAIFRPGNLVRSPLMPFSLKNRGNYSKRFVFGKQDIERLRNDYYHPSEHRHRPSRVKTLSAFIWAAVIRAILPANPNLKTHLLTNVVNLRKKLNPPLPSQCLGNISQAVAARWESEADGDGSVTPGFLVGRVAEAINKVTDDYVREMHVEGGYLKAILDVSKELHNADEIKILSISSWCNFPFSQVDFGWGKPIWISLGHTPEDTAIFLDAENGGIEVWIGLAQEIMCNLDKNMEFNAYVSFSQIFSEPSCPLRSAVYVEDRESPV
nr:vinorine synthase-like [Ipomoea batatas]